jgi:hypothetical protein
VQSGGEKSTTGHSEVCPSGSTKAYNGMLSGRTWWAAVVRWHRESIGQYEIQSDSECECIETIGVCEKNWRTECTRSRINATLLILTIRPWFPNEIKKIIARAVSKPIQINRGKS